MSNSAYILIRTNPCHKCRITISEGNYQVLKSTETKPTQRPIQRPIQQVGWYWILPVYRDLNCGECGPPEKIILSNLYGCNINS